MAEDGGEDAFRIGAGEGEVVGVADAGGLDLHQHLALTRTFEIDGLDAQLLPGLADHGGANLHDLIPVVALGGECGVSASGSSAARTHLRMTEGSAAPSSASAGCRNPSAAISFTAATNTVRRSSKWVKTCRTSPALRHAASAGACPSASASAQGVARQSVPGSSVIPPSSPSGLRRRSSTRPAASVSQKCAP